jgi:hypothetical protein
MTSHMQWAPGRAAELSRVLSSRVSPTSPSGRIRYIRYTLSCARHVVWRAVECQHRLFVPICLGLLFLVPPPVLECCWSRNPYLDVASLIYWLDPRSGLFL